MSKGMRSRCQGECEADVNIIQSRYQGDREADVEKAFAYEAIDIALPIRAQYM